jgi:hypothetical protein
MASANCRRQNIIPDRGPRRDLCVVVVTMWLCTKGLQASPAATNPLMCAMSVISRAPTESAIYREILADFLMCQNGPDARDPTYLTHAVIIPITGVSAGASNDELGLEHASSRFESIVVYEACNRINLVWERLKIYAATLV